MNTITTGWAELPVWPEHSRKDPARGWHHWNRCRRLTISDTLTVYDPDWKNEVVIHKPHFRSRSHGRGDWDNGGHNWYMTTRIDVWFEMPDGYCWWGALITAGYNCTFRVRRTKHSPVIALGAWLKLWQPSCQPDIEPADNFLRIRYAGSEWFALHRAGYPWGDGWHIGENRGEAVRAALQDQALAA